MRRTRPLRALSGGLLLVVVSSGCARTIAGNAVAEPLPTTGTAVAAPARSTGPVLLGDAVRDECLLDAAELAALLDAPVDPPENRTTTRADGTTARGCTAAATEGDPPALAAVNVYGVRDGAPADVVRAGLGRRELSEVGDAAAVVDTASGPTMQIASRKYLVTIAVAERRPSDAQWRAAGRAALSRLP
ncbi:hypothetical protein [Pseudonocardia sp.]|uniref:hypothetical protein n=1 Tax=Pseudonocardia sp. TaxID=60912 RepID=UPI0031FBE5E1